MPMHTARDFYEHPCGGFLDLCRIVLLMTAVFAVPVYAQKPDPSKFNDAIKRSKTAADIITRLPQVSPNSMPKEIIDKSEAIGVFLCTKTDLLFEHAILCPGVISRYGLNGWSLPAFYRFGAGGLGRPDSALAGVNAVMLLFMNQDSINWLKGRFELKGKKKAVAGYLGSITKEQSSELVKAPLIAYVVFKDELAGRALSGGFFRGFAIGEDNNINKPLYGIKGHELLSGKVVSKNPLSREISAFQESLQKYYSR